MTIPEKVVAFLHDGEPGAFCDDCIREGLGLPRRQEVAIVTLTLMQRVQSGARELFLKEAYRHARKVGHPGSLNSDPGGKYGSRIRNSNQGRR